MSMSSYFKQNEKVIMVVLLALIAPTFAFTGLFYSVFTRNESEEYYIFGEPVSAAEIRRCRNQVAQFRQAMGARFYGPTVLSSKPRIDPQSIMDYYMLLEEARRLGVRTSDEELQKEVVDIALDLIAWHKVQQSGISLTTVKDARNAFDAQRKETKFTLDDYRDVLRDPDFGLRITVENFELQIRNNMTAYKVQKLVQESTAVSEKEVYEAFENEFEERAVEYVRIPISRFAKDAGPLIDDEFRRRIYKEQRNEFREPDRVTIEIAKVKADEIVIPDEELRARYEADKGDLYTTRVEDESGTQTSTVTPFEEVRELVANAIKRERQESLLSAALAAANAKHTAGETYELLDCFAEDRGLIDVFVSARFGKNEFSNLTDYVRNDAALNRMFIKFGELKVGDLSPEIVQLPSGSYFYRIHELFPSHVPPFEDVTERLDSVCADAKAHDLAVDYLNEWKKKVEEDEAVTWESFVRDENLTAFEAGPFNRRSNYQFEDGEGKRIRASGDLARATFAIPEVGGVSEPVAPAYAKEEVYLVCFKESRPPDSAGYAQERDRLRQRLLREKQSLQLEKFMSDLRARADVRVPQRAS